MAIFVSIPIRLRIDRTALELPPEWIEDAVAAAVGRAMESSRQVVIDPRGGFMGVTVHEPTFRWHGLPVHPHQRAGLERMLGELIRDLAEEHEIRPPSRGPEVLEVMPDDPREHYDDTRGSPFLERSTIASYEGGQVDLPVQGTKLPRMFVAAQVKKVTDLHDEALDKIYELAKRATEHQRLGIIFRYEVGGTPGWQGMKEDMEAITDPGTFAKKSNLTADLDIADDVDRAFSPSTPTFAEHETKPTSKIRKSRTRARPQAERLDRLRESFNGLKIAHEAGHEAVRKAARLAPKELWQAVASETEGGQNRLIEALKAKAGPRMSDAELADLEQAVRQMSHQRAISQRERGTLEGSLRTKGLPGLRPEVREIVAGNRTLELLAAENPEELQRLYDNWRTSRSPQTPSGFQGYVRNEMVSFYSGMHGEFTAAFTLGQIHQGDIVFVKVPDLEPRVPGTDLVAVYKGDKVWMIDNKAYSQSLVDKVTALTGSFPKNISDDAASFAGNPKLGRRGDPVIGDAVARLQKASNEIKRFTKDLDTKEIAKPAIQEQIDAICRDNGIERVVTNAGGVVIQISAAIDAAGVLLMDLGITRRPGRP